MTFRTSVTSVPAFRVGGIIRRIAGLAIILWSGLACYCIAVETSNPERLFEEAVAAQQRGDDGDAVRKYRELLQTHPEAVAVRVNLGAVLANLKHFDEAIEQYHIVLASNPGNRIARMNLALAYDGKGDLLNAITELRRLHREDSDDREYVMLLADCYLQLGRYKDAVSLLAPLEHAQSDDADLEWLLGSAMIHTGRLLEGVSRVERVAAKTANADAYLLAGQTRFGMSQYDLAQNDAEAAGKLTPSLAGLDTLRGMILERTADYEGAQAVLQRAIAADPKDFNAHFYLGAIFYFKRDMDNAKLHLTRALQLNPASAEVRYELALVARADGDLYGALRDLEIVVRQAPDWLQPHVELSTLYFRLQRPEDGTRERQIVDRIMAAQQRSQTQAAP